MTTEIKRIDVVKKGRMYLLPSGKLVGSVTNKLGILAKPALIWWAANIEREYVVEKAVEMSRRGPLTAESLTARLGTKKAHQLRLKTAGDIGTSLHEAIQEHLKGDMGEKVVEPELEGPALLAYMAWEDWSDGVRLEPTHVETMLGSERLDVGGTLDCAGWACNPEMDEQKTHTIFDWKSSARSKTSPNGIYPEAEIQVAVYRELAIEMGLADDDSWAAVVRLPKHEDDPCLKEKKPFDVLWIDPERCTELATGFMSIGSAWTFMKTAFEK